MLHPLRLAGTGSTGMAGCSAAVGERHAMAAGLCSREETGPYCTTERKVKTHPCNQ